MARVAITAAMIRMVFGFLRPSRCQSYWARAVGSSMAVTAESSISAKRAATCFPLSFTREKIVPIVFLSARRTRILA